MNNINEVKQEPTFYKFCAALVSVMQLSPEEWDLGPMSKKNWKEISMRTNKQNDLLKELAVNLKHTHESKVSALKEENKNLEHLLVLKSTEAEVAQKLYEEMKAESERLKALVEKAFQAGDDYYYAANLDLKY